MSYWQGVRFLIWNEIRHARWKNLFLFVIVAYTTLTTFKEVEAIVIGDDEFSSFLVDYLCIMMFSVAGLCVSMNYGLGFKKDLINERLSYWRTLPIKIDQIVWTRLILTTLTSFIAVGVYCYLVAVAIILSGHSIEVGAYILFGLTLYSISYVFNTMYLYVEMVKSYKSYMIYCWVKPFVMLVIILTYTLAWGFSLLESIYYAAQQAPWVMGLASLVMIIAAFLLVFRLINEKIRQRNIL